jgi:hypothetical protein
LPTGVVPDVVCAVTAKFDDELTSTHPLVFVSVTPAGTLLNERLMKSTLDVVTVTE